MTKKEASIVLGIGSISMATILAEICVTKFVSYKLYHHYTYAIISLVMFSFGLAGVTVFLRSGSLGDDRAADWKRAAESMLAFAFSLLIGIPIYCSMPLSPDSSALPFWYHALTLSLCMVVIALPFYAAGIGISHTFSAAKISVSRLYFWDLLAAALGAALAPLALEFTGGYGTILLAAVLGLIASGSFYAASGESTLKQMAKPTLSWLLIAAAFLAYPSLSVRCFGYDILSYKDPRFGALFNNYGGLSRTFWNAIARIDVSRTAHCNMRSLLTWGLSPTVNPSSLTGRYILVDGGASTRQLYLKQPINESAVIKTALFGAPYVVRPTCQRSMVIGGGGGIDIFIAKYWKTPQLDILELNPSTYKFLTGTADDPERDLYLKNLQSDNTTKVNVINEEGRHYCSHATKGTYDIVQLSGVDTLTAITSGGMSLAENYLYTKEALEDYSRLTKPDGVICISHWRQEPPVCALRTFNTDLSYLSERGAPDPSKCLLVIAADYTEIMMKRQPFTDAEMARIKAWSRESGYEILYDPTNPIVKTADSRDALFGQLAIAAPQERAKLVADYPFNITPVSDDRPYFYRTSKQNAQIFAFHVEDSTHIAAVIFGLLGAVLLTFLPLLKVRRSAGKMAPALVFFALSGFAFLLFETSIIQVLGIFVGGPLYSMATVFVAVFAGYAIGSILSPVVIKDLRIFFIVSALVSALFFATYLGIHPLVHYCLPLPLPARMAISVAITLIISIPTGMLVPFAAGKVRDAHGSTVAWMWAVNSAFNVMGALCYVPISQAVGIRYTFLVCSILYLAGGVAWQFTRTGSESSSAPQANPLT